MSTLIRKDYVNSILESAQGEVLVFLFALCLFPFNRSNAKDIFNLFLFVHNFFPSEFVALDALKKQAETTLMLPEF